MTRSMSNRSCGHPGREVREDAGQLGPLPGRVEEPVGDRRRGLDPLALAVLDHEVEAAGRAQALDRRRLEDRHPRVADLLGEPALELPGQADGPQLGRGPVVPLLEDHERGGGVGLVDRVDGVVAVEDQHVADAVELPGDLADAPGGPAGRLAGRAVGRLHDDDQVALVLGRDERLGALVDQPAGQRQQAERGQDDGPPVAGPEVEERVVGVLDPLQAAVEPAERRELRLAVLGPEEQPGDRRGERQRVERREEEREDDRQGELVVEPAGEARDERHRDEHRRQDQADRDDRRRDLGHRRPGRLQRPHPALEELLDVLHDDDRVVDHQADRQHQPAHRQRVDREPEGGHHRERGDQRDRDRDHRDDRGAEALEEHEHDDQHQHERLDERVPHLGDVLADVEGRVVGDPVFQALREVPGDAVHLRADLLDDVQGVGVGELVDRDRAGGLAVEPAGRLVVLRVELDAGDVGEVDDRAVVVAADDDLLELLDLREPPLGRDRVLEPLAGRRRQGADLAGGGLLVLLLDRLDDLGGRDPLVGHAVRVEPDPHGVLAAERVHVADARDPLEGVDDVDLAVVVEERRVVPAVGRDRG